MYVYGGIIVKDGQKTSDVMWMSTDRMEWHVQPCTGEIPPPRDGHVLVFDEERNWLVVFGGRNQDKKRMNDVHYLDTETWVWHKPSCEGTPPSPREVANGVIWQGHLLLFGEMG